MEDDLSQQIARWAAKQAASDKLGRQLTKEEQAFYDSSADLGLSVVKLIQKILD